MPSEGDPRDPERCGMLRRGGARADRAERKDPMRRTITASVLIGTIAVLTSACTGPEAAVPVTVPDAPLVATSAPTGEAEGAVCVDAGPGLVGMVTPLLRDGATTLGEAHRAQAEGATVLGANVYRADGSVLSEGAVWFVASGLAFAMTDGADRYSFAPSADALPSPPRWTEAMTELVEGCVRTGGDGP